MSEARTVNGVDVGELSKAVATMRAEPTLARFKFRAQNIWVNGGRNRTLIKGFYGGGGEQRTEARPFMLETDEPPLLLGTDQAPNPVEHLLNALASCLTTSLVYHAASRGIELQEVESSLEGDLDIRGFLGVAPEVRRGYEGIRVHFRVKGDVPEEKLQELCRYSPVFDVVTNGTPVDISFELK